MWWKSPHKGKTVAPEKNSNPRIFKLSTQLKERINKLPKDSETWFGIRTLDHFARNFGLQRRRAAKKIGNPRINRISFKTLCHWKATMEYHRTRDILHVMNILGHKNIKNTPIYTPSKRSRRRVRLKSRMELGRSLQTNRSRF